MAFLYAMVAVILEWVNSTGVSGQLYSGDYMIDCGGGNYDFTSCIDPVCSNIHVALTHAHMDHIGGLSLLLSKYPSKVRSLILPLHTNEIAVIAYSLLHLKGKHQIDQSHRVIVGLKDFISAQRLYKEIELQLPEGITWGYEGKKLCNHFKFLNPPIFLCEENKSTRFEKRESVEDILQLFEENYQRGLRKYFYSTTTSNNFIDDGFIRNNQTPDNEIDGLLLQLDNDLLEKQELTDNNIEYVFRFFQSNYAQLSEFNAHPLISTLSNVTRELDYCSHDACLVFTYQCANCEKVLFTGDASLKVLNRLIRNNRNDVQCKYLKMPHHGSKKNIDENILREINPSVAILCHDNARFGRSKDTHPNIETIDLIAKLGIKQYTTNDVVKDGRTWIQTRNNYSDSFLE